MERRSVRLLIRLVRILVPGPRETLLHETSSDEDEDETRYPADPEENVVS